MVVYFPKNGKSVVINGIQIKRPGLPMQFEVKIYEKWVEKGLLVKRAQDMDPLSPEELNRQVQEAAMNKQPVFIPPEQNLQPAMPMNMVHSAPVKQLVQEPMQTESLNEYDLALIEAINKKRAEKGESPVDLKALKEQQAAAQEPVQPVEQVKVVTEEPEHKGGVFSHFAEHEPVAKPEDVLTYEKALSQVKRNEDGSLKIGKDGTYVLTPGAKPWKKSEICDMINSHK